MSGRFGLEHTTGAQHARQNCNAEPGRHASEYSIDRTELDDPHVPSPPMDKRFQPIAADAALSEGKGLFECFRRSIRRLEKGKRHMIEGKRC